MEETEAGNEETNTAIKKAEPKKPRLNIPAYLIMLFLVLGIVGGVALKLILFPGEVDNGSNGQPVNKVVHIILLYSDDCEICLNTNSILESFSVNEVEYNVERIEIASPEGQELVERYNINSVPTALVDYEKIALFYPEVKNAMDASFLMTDGEYIVPESQLNINLFYPVMYLKKIEESCVDSEDKIDIIMFDDPYSRASLNSKAVLTDVWLDFNKDVDVRFNYTPADIGDIVPDYNMDEVLLTSKFLTCASEQDLYLKMDIFFRGIFCNIPDNDEDLLTKGEIAGCGVQSYISTHYGRPLSQLELDIAANRTGLDSNVLMECFENSDEKIEESVVKSVAYNILRVPTAVVDCKYVVNVDWIVETICTIDSNIENCEKWKI